nr:PIN domain-containing protein [Brucella anthropi]
MKDLKMNEQFEWYFNHLNVDFEKVWSTGFLTLDANVLLNLYRYHTDTANDLISAIESFGSRVWISHQAVTEFINNRKKVIVESQSNYSNGLRQIAEFKESAADLSKKLVSQRTFSKDFITGIQSEIDSIIDNAIVKAKQEVIQTGSTGSEDQILKKIIKIFKGKVGSHPKNIEDLHKEAKRRIDFEIPPGYKDKDKTGERAYGDYLLWQQILDQSKTLKKPIILVTSEQKPDWWEIHSGKTLGPRLELIKEASLYTEQPIVIYQTDRFLEYSLDKAGKKSEKPVAEVREIAERHEKTIAKSNLIRVMGVIEHKLSDSEKYIGSSGFTVASPADVVLVTGLLDIHFTTIGFTMCTVSACPSDVSMSDLNATISMVGPRGYIIRLNSKNGKPIQPGQYSCYYMLTKSNEHPDDSILYP